MPVQHAPLSNKRLCCSFCTSPTSTTGNDTRFLVNKFPSRILLERANFFFSTVHPPTLFVPTIFIYSYTLFSENRHLSHFPYDSPALPAVSEGRTYNKHLKTPEPAIIRFPRDTVKIIFLCTLQHTKLTHWRRQISCL